ncbi:MAG: FAD-dependent thymidylate synthase [Candidatus Micrarchaeia archaeon]
MPGIKNYKVAITEEDEKKLEQYFINNTNPDPQYNIFVLNDKTLTAEEKAVLAARFSRSKEISIKNLFLREFLRENEDNAVINKTLSVKENEKIRRKSDRIINEYGDDSVLDMASALVGIEGIDQVVAKIIEDCRLCGFIEKSTRFVDFSIPLKLNEKGEIIGYADPNERYSSNKKYYLYKTYDVIENSKFANAYNQAMDELFETFAKMVEKTIIELKNRTPITEQEFPNSNNENLKYDELSEEEKEIAEKAYNIAIKAKAFDICRAILPMATITNLAWHSDFRSFNNTLIKMYASDDPEASKVADYVYDVLYKYAPSLISKVKNEHSKDLINYLKSNQQKLQELAKELEHLAKSENEYDSYSDKIADTDKKVEVLRADGELTAKEKIAVNTIYSYTYLGPKTIQKILSENADFVNKIINAVNEDRDNRWKKPPRSFESTMYTVKMSAPISVYRDLQRNRFVLHIPKPFTIDNGYKIPDLIYDIGFDREFKDKIEGIENIYRTFKANEKLKYYANRAVTFAHIIDWIDVYDLREADWYIRLRTSAQGDDVYRKLMFEVYDELKSVQPELIGNIIRIKKPEEGEIGQQLNRAAALFKSNKKIKE